MTSLLLSLFIGILIGFFKLFPQKYLSFNNKIQIFALIILLFTMGASLGSNDDLLSNISTIGLKSFSFAIFTSIFSILLLYFFTKTILNVKTKTCDEDMKKVKEGF